MALLDTWHHSKGALHCFRYILINQKGQINQPSLFPWSTTWFHMVLLCLYVADPATFLASDGVLGSYFLPRTASLFSYGKQKIVFISSPKPQSAPLNQPVDPLHSHLDVELEGVHGLLQRRLPLLLRQLDAVHPAPVQLLEAVGAAHAGEGEKGKPLFAAQPQRFLGNLPQHLTSG